MNFSEALNELKVGHKVCREGWNGKNMWIEVQFPDSNSKMTQPYIYMKTADDELIPWLASQSDIFGGDWDYFTAQ